MPDPVIAPFPASVTPDPVSVTVIGTDNVGLSRRTETVATTPGAHQSNVIVRVIAPMTAIFVRFINLFLVTLVGLLIAGMTPAGGKLLYTKDFYHLVLTCANLSLPGAALGFVKDLVTVFGRLEQEFPLSTGSV